MTVDRGGSGGGFLVSRRGLPPVVARPPARPLPPESRSYALLVLVGRPLWSWRLEVTALAVVAVLVVLGARVMTLGAALAGLTAVVLLVIGVPALRTRVGWQLHRCRLLRSWQRAARHAGLATANDRIPTVRAVRRVPAGELLRVRVPDGASVRDVEDAADVLAAMLEVRDVTVTRDPGNARYALVGTVRRDPLAEGSSAVWPLLEVERTALADPVPVGVDEAGHPVTVSLLERNVLLGGEPGAGKSVAQSLLVAAAALDPGVDLVLLDGKQVELAPWAGCARAVVGPDVAEAVRLLDDLRAEMDDRYARLLAAGRRKLAPGDGIRPVMLVVDELAFFTAGGDRRETAAFSASLRDLVARGRAAGMIVVAATQKPSADIVPTFVRDLFAFRWALRCTTPQASDTILGQGWASAGASAATIDAAARGVGWLLAEGGRPVRLRSYLLDDDHLVDLAARAAALRSRPTTTSTTASAVSGLGGSR